MIVKIRNLSLNRERLVNKSYDSTYFSSFQIKTPIVYTSKVLIDPKIEKKFQKDWKKFYSKEENELSDTREKSLIRFMDKLEEEGDDDFTRNWVSIRYIGKNMGYGVFAKQDLPPYKALTHYAGVLKLDKSIKETNDSTFVFTDFAKYAIDGASKGNWARFMNHADEKQPEKNVIPWELYLEEGPRIVFTTGSKGVKKGKQLLYSYGDSYWD